MTYMAHWYGADANDQYIDPTPITADTPEEATKIAYSHFNGNPPHPLLYLEEVK